MSEADLWREIERLRERQDYLEALESALAQTGTWTPTFAGTTIAGVFTYTTQVGRYIKIGKQVTVNCQLSISAAGTLPTGTPMMVQGLPFASNTSYSAAFGFLSNWDVSAGAFLTGLVTGTVLNIYECIDNGAGAYWPIANFINRAVDMYFTATYSTA